MNYNKVQFTAAYGTSQQLKPSVRPEVSFVGRSNVGKSSLLNKFFNRKALAKVSSKPGKTSTINFFQCEDVDFVDLPGYGYAQVSKSETGRWTEMIEGYFNQERAFALVVSLVDIRHPASALDEQMIEFLVACELPFVICLTKADKLSKNQQIRQMNAIRKQLGFAPDEVDMVVTSSESGQGMSDLKAVINRYVAEFWEYQRQEQ